MLTASMTENRAKYPHLIALGRCQELLKDYFINFFSTIFSISLTNPTTPSIIIKTGVPGMKLREVFYFTKKSAALGAFEHPYFFARFTTETPFAIA